MKQFLSLFLLIILLFNHTRAVVFQNSPPADPDRSSQLQEVAGTMRSLVQNILDIQGISLQRPFSNQENSLILNVLLYDIEDGSPTPALSAKGYFAPFDQLRTRGISNINEVSNFGNLIFMDIGLLDPTQGLPTEAADKTQAKLYGNKFIFYQSFVQAFQFLLNFQAHNPYSVDSTKISTGDIVREYKWLDRSMGAFLGFRATRTSLELQGRIGIGTGLRVDNSTEFLFNTCGAVSDFRDICTNSPQSSFSSALQAIPFSVVRYLHPHNQLTRPTDDFIDNLPGLFHPDLGPPVVPAAGATASQVLDAVERDFTQQEMSTAMGFLTFLYIWEQLEANVRGAGDEFLVKALKSEIRSFSLEGNALSKNIFTSQTCDRNSLVPVDKICALDQALRQIQNTLPNQDERTFSDYFLDMGSAIFLDTSATSRTPLGLFEIRNLNLRDIDSITSVDDTFLSTGNRLGINFTRSIREPDQVGGQQEEEVVVDAGGADGGAADAGAADAGAADADAGGGDAGAADAGAGEVPVDEGADSESRLDLTTFSLGFVSLENRRNTADVSFPFLDQLDLEDGDVDSDPASVKSRRLDLGQATPRTGTTTYIVQKAQSGSISRTAAIVFQGLSQTSVSFQERRAAFSRSKIQRVGQDEQSLPAVRDPWSIYTSFKEALFQPQLTRRESSATILSTSGIKEWDIYEPLHEIRAKQPEDTLAFREYTTSFRTLDLRSNATLFQVIPRTAILKEKIEGVGGGQNFKIMLWVDQVFLPGSDSFTVPQTETVGLETPPDSQVQLDPETQVLTSLESQLQNQSVLDQVVRIPARVGKLLTVQNPFDVPLKILFFLTNGGSASQKFQISEGVATSTGKIIPIPLLPAKVFTRDSVMRAVERIDQENFVNPKGSKAFLILNKTDDDDDLILKLSRSTAVVAAAPFTVSGGGGGGCFIATASFGSMEHPAVKSFCRFRDEFLLKSALGREFVSFYYRNSPAVAQVLRSHPLLRTMVVIALTPVWWLLEGMWLKLILQFLLLILLLMATLQIYKSTNSQPS